MKKLLTLCFSVLLINVFNVDAVKAQLNGRYTIGGSGANYATLTAAFNALKTQGGNSVIFEVRAGTYNESVSINLNEVSGNPNLIIRGTSATVTSSNSSATISITGSLLEFTGMRVINTSSAGTALKLTDISFTTIANNTFQANSGGTVVDIAGSILVNFQNNYLTGGKRSLRMTLADEPTIYRNELRDFAEVGLSITGHSSYYHTATIESNYIYSYKGDGYIVGLAASNGQSYYIYNNEIYLNDPRGAEESYGVICRSITTLSFIHNIITGWGEVTGSDIVGSTTVYAERNSVLATCNYGMSINATNVYFKNNEVTMAHSPIYQGYAVDLRAKKADIINNSTYLYGGNSEGAAFRFQGIGGDQVVFANNSFQNANSYYRFNAIQLENLDNVRLVGHCNNYYSASSVLAQVEGVELRNLTEWRNYTGLDTDARSISMDPIYSDPELNSLQIFRNSPLVGRASITYLQPVDITGRTRQFNAQGCWDPINQNAPSSYTIMPDAVSATTEIDFNVKEAEVIVSYEGKEAVSAQVHIVNLLNNSLVKSINITLIPGQDNRVDISSVAGGMYGVNIDTGACNLSKKVYIK